MKNQLEKNEYGLYGPARNTSLTASHTVTNKIKSQLQKSVLHLTEICIRKLDIPD